MNLTIVNRVVLLTAIAVVVWGTALFGQTATFDVYEGGVQTATKTLDISAKTRGAWANINSTTIGVEKNLIATGSLDLRGDLLADGEFFFSYGGSEKLRYLMSGDRLRAKAICQADVGVKAKQYYNYDSGSVFLDPNTDDVRLYGGTTDLKLYANAGDSDPAMTIASGTNQADITGTATFKLLQDDGDTTFETTDDGHVLVGGAVDDGVNALQVNGFSRFGDAATGVKMKLLKGTTTGSEGDAITKAHGLTGDKIVAITSIIRNATDRGVAPGYFPGDELLYHLSYTDTNAILKLSTSDSGNLTTKPYVIMIWYEE